MVKNYCELIKYLFEERKIDRNNKQKMCDCSDSTDYSSDENRELLGDSESKLVPLNFTNYEKYGFHKKLLDTGFYLTNFDKKNYL